jgi:EAL and modified HD-GYP domain-containing signal transduction protein
MLLKHLRSLLSKSQGAVVQDDGVITTVSGVPVWVARQPVFTAQGGIWGYELLSRVCPENVCRPAEDAYVATSSVVFDGVEMVAPALAAGERLLINYSGEMLVDGVPAMLPPDICVVEVLEDVQPTQEVLAALLRLRQAGYMVALDDYIGQEAAETLMPLADIVKVDVLGREREAIARDVAQIRPYGCTLLAEKVEDRQMFDLCAELGFDLFQGFFFSRPQLVAGKKLTSSETVKTRLLARMASGDYDMAELGDIIRVDAALSTRLLRYLNSAFFALPSPVVSVSQAAGLLGQEKLRRWLCVAILSDMESSPLSRHVAVQAAQRGKFLELVCGTGCGRPASEMFMLGLLSMLDGLLSVSMESVIAGMPLDEQLTDALLGRPGPLLPWLRFAAAYEKGDWQQAAELARRLGVSGEEVSRCYSEAISWAAVMFA